MIYQYATPIDCRLIEHGDLPKYGVLEVARSVFIPVRLEGYNRFVPFKHTTAPEAIMSFDSEASTWEWLKLGPQYHT